MHDWNARSLPELHERLLATGWPRRLLELARDEDLGPCPGTPHPGGDITSTLVIEPHAQGTYKLVAREPGVMAGLAFVPLLLEVFGVSIRFEPLASDSQSIQPGSILATFTGPVRQILSIERTMLNLLSRLCGIATRTAKFVAEARRFNPHVEILDTRKTTPGLRVFEKYAVRCGGGSSHRFGLYDAVLVKDNHLAGKNPSQLGNFLYFMRAKSDHSMPSFFEIEVDSLEQFRILLNLKNPVADLILLDNMLLASLEEAVALNRASGLPFRLEASGGVRLDTIGRIAATGVDRISVGSLTHGAMALDLGLDA
jgi:nicotinate-nucleotide pyrophosphorylase (carboxylating)